MTYLLSTRVSATIDGVLLIETLRWWINHHPDLVYKMVYLNLPNLPHFKINKDAHGLLMEQLKKNHPNLVEKIRKRRTNHMLRSKMLRINH